MLRLPLKRGCVGQYREAGCAARLIGARQRWGIEVGADQAFRRARLLHFGNQCVFTGFQSMLDGGEKATRYRCSQGCGFEFGERTRALRHLDFLALIGLDLRKNVGHRPPQALEIAIRRSRRPSASPESTALVASATPCFMSLPRPATISPVEALRIATS